MPELWERIYKVADAAQPKFRTALLDVFDQVKYDVKFRALQRALGNGDTVAAWNSIPWEAIPDMEATQDLNKILGDIFKNAGSKTMADMMGKPKVEFNAIDEDTATFWAQNESSYLITHITEQMRSSIQRAVQNAFLDGLAPPNKQVFTVLEHAINIREDLGLNARQVSSMDKYRSDLRWSGITGPAYDKLVAKRQHEFLLARTDMIARTETIQSAAEGQRATWDMQIAEGRLDSARWEVEWLVTPDDVTCKRCFSMRGKRRSINGVYQGVPYSGGPAGRGTKGPTLHPNCRCTERLVPRRGRASGPKRKTRTALRAQQVKIPPTFVPPQTPPSSSQTPEYDGVKFEWPAEVAREYPEMMRAIGSSTRIDDWDLDVIRRHVRDINLIPTEALQKLANSGVMFHIGDGGVVKLDRMERLKGVQPRGWSEGSMWDDVGGCYGNNWVLVGNARGGSVSVALHEAGHAVGEHYYVRSRREFQKVGVALESVEHSQTWKKIHTRLYKAGVLGDYYRQGGAGAYAGMEELWAESFATYHKSGALECTRQYGKAVTRYIEYAMKSGKAM